MDESVKNALDAVLRDVQITEATNTRNPGTDYRCRNLMVDHGEEIAAAVNSHASLVEEVERLREACSALLAHWDKNDGKEKRGEFEGVQYWSPAGRMVDTDYIVAIREALEKNNA